MAWRRWRRKRRTLLHVFRVNHSPGIPSETTGFASSAVYRVVVGSLSAWRWHVSLVAARMERTWNPNVEMNPDSLRQAWSVDALWDLLFVWLLEIRMNALLARPRSCSLMLLARIAKGKRTLQSCCMFCAKLTATTSAMLEGLRWSSTGQIIHGREGHRLSMFSCSASRSERPSKST